MPSTTPAHASIREQARAPDYPTRALTSIVQIAGATDPATLIARLVDVTAAMGASASLYTAALTDGDGELSCFNLFAGQPAYIHAQNELGSLIAHPWFRIARKHLPSGSDRRVRIEVAADADAMRLAREYGFRSCFIVPTPSGHELDRLGMLCVGSEHPDDFEGPEAGVIRTLARSLAAELHDWLLHYLRQRLVQTAQLEQTDMELLALEYRGLQSKEIANLTRMSKAAVDSRFQRINMRLRCSSRKASAMRAAAYGLLEPT
jgi:DNA-binding CsgD family transcriptional regulator